MMEKKTVLIVEDEKGMRESLSEFITEAGYSVLIAEDGESAVTITKQRKPDLVILDIILPKKDGFEVLKELKEDGETRTIPIILCTNLSEPSDIQRALELGAKTYLVKANYSLVDIVKKVDEVVQKQNMK